MSASRTALAALWWIAALGFAPLLGGVSAFVQARLSGLAGPGPLQPYRTLRKLLAKEGMAPRASSAVFWLGPLLSASACALAMIAVPAVYDVPPLPFADPIALAYLLMAATFFTVLAALDTGTAFGGMGASRETMVAALAEPTLMVALLGLVTAARTDDVGTALLAMQQGEVGGLTRWIVVAALALAALAENARLPFDNPTTHLELTMIHEAMVLEHSGPQLALVQYGAAAKLTLFWLVILAAFVPVVPMGVPVALGAVSGIALLLVKIVVGGVMLGVVETLFVKVRIFRAPDLLTVAFVLAMFGLILGAVGT